MANQQAPGNGNVGAPRSPFEEAQAAGALGSFIAELLDYQSCVVEEGGRCGPMTKPLFFPAWHDPRNFHLNKGEAFVVMEMQKDMALAGAPPGSQRSEP